ncbi:MAG: hypothetical protein LBR51_02290 [Bacteroidales bacterium]|nr:hypothetical protein [Bacteroidales bacterium]
MKNIFALICGQKKTGNDTTAACFSFFAVIAGPNPRSPCLNCDFRMIEVITMILKITQIK